MSRSGFSAPASLDRYLYRSGAVVTAAPLTISAWVYPHTAFSPINSIVDLHQAAAAGSRQYFLLQIQTGLTVQFTVSDSSAGTSASGPTTVPLGAWSHIAGVTASSTSRFCYVNGAAGTENTTSRTPASLDETLVGMRGGTTKANAAEQTAIGDVAIWNINLTPAEILALSRGVNPRSVRPANLVCYWPLTGNVGGFEVDAGPRGNLPLRTWGSGTLLNFPDHPRYRGAIRRRYFDAGAGGDVSASLTGLAGTAAQQGDESVLHVNALAGHEVSGAQGEITTSVGYGATLSGLEAMVERGDPASAHVNAALGIEATSTAGNCSAGVDCGISGQEAAHSSGVVGTEHVNDLVGQEGASEEGTLAHGQAVDLAGAESVVDLGAVRSDHEQALAGQEAVVSKGEITAQSAGQTVLVGQELTATSGTLVVEHSNALVGQQIDVTQGQITAQILNAADLVGLEATIQQGAVASAHAQLQVGQTVTGEQGAVVVAHQQAATGAQMAVNDGAAQASHAQPLAGAGLSTEAGTVLQSQQGALSGAEITAQPGSGAPALQVDAAGQEIVATQGELTAFAGADLSVNLSGQQVVASGGEVPPDHLLTVTGLPATAQVGVPQIYVQQRHAKIPYTLGPPNLFVLAARRHNEQTARRNNVQTARRNNAQGARRTPS